MGMFEAPGQISGSATAGLSSALAAAMSGTRPTQAPLLGALANIGKANAPGSAAQDTKRSGGTVSGALMAPAGINRQLDLFLQDQLRTEISGGAYADQIANFLTRLQGVYGKPGGHGGLKSRFDELTTALKKLSKGANNRPAQSAVVSAAQGLAQQLNAATDGIQALRGDVEQDIGNSATQANAAIALIADLNARLQSVSPSDPRFAMLRDQRNNAINTLARYIDLRVVTDETNGVSVFTNSGVQLVGAGPTSEFSFLSRGKLDAGSSYDASAARNGVGQLDLKLADGASLDVAANKLLGSGRIAADLKLRDQTLVQAQTQVDQFAASMTSALSDKITPGIAIAGSSSAFSVPTTGLLAGNTINLSYTDRSNIPRRVAIVNVADPAALPLKNTPNANPTYVGVDFSHGLGPVVSQLNNAFGSTHLRFGAAGSNLIVSGDGTNQAIVKAASATTTVQAVAGAGAQLPLFTDAGEIFTGAITNIGSRTTGLAGRISVNPALVADPGKVSTAATSPPAAAANSARPDFLLAQLVSTKFTFSPATGLGSVLQPFEDTVTGYLEQFIGQQANASRLATQLQQGQSVVVSTLQQKLSSTAAVDMDSEMLNLIEVQNSYAANAHIMSVVQDVMKSLAPANP